MPAGQLYFAYGSNMDDAQMCDRCPSVQFVDIARLRGFKFMINERGVATLNADKASEVWGVIWEIQHSDISELDRREGVPTYYSKKHIYVVDSKNKSMHVMIYVDKRTARGPSRNGYIDKIITAAQKNKLPDTYIDELRTWE